MLDECLKSKLFFLGCVDHDHVIWLKKYFDFNAFFIPHYVSINSLKSDETKDKNEVIFSGSILDVENEENLLISQFTGESLKLHTEIVHLCNANPYQSLWDIIELYIKHFNLETCFQSEAELFEYKVSLFHNYEKLIRAKRKIKLVQTLKDFKLVIYGNSLWQNI